MERWPTGFKRACPDVTLWRLVLLYRNQIIVVSHPLSSETKNLLINVNMLSLGTWISIDVFFSLSVVQNIAKNRSTPFSVISGSTCLKFSLVETFSSKHRGWNLSCSYSRISTFLLALWGFRRNLSHISGYIWRHRWYLRTSFWFYHCFKSHTYLLVVLVYLSLLVFDISRVCHRQI